MAGTKIITDKIIRYLDLLPNTIEKVNLMEEQIQQ